MAEALAMQPIKDDNKSIIVKEKKEKVLKLWKKAVKMGVKVEQFRMDAAPFVLKVVSIFVPEAAPITAPLAAFLSSKSGKKFREIAKKNEAAMGKAITGDFEEAKEDFKNSFSSISSDEGLEMATDIKNTVEEIKGKSK